MRNEAAVSGELPVRPGLVQIIKSFVVANSPFYIGKFSRNADFRDAAALMARLLRIDRAAYSGVAGRWPVRRVLQHLLEGDIQ